LKFLDDLYYKALANIDKKTDGAIYQGYKAMLIAQAEKAGPLIAYPLLAFLELELDSIYKEKGLNGVREAVKKWLDDYQKGWEKTLDEIVNPPEPKPLKWVSDFKAGDRIKIRWHDSDNLEEVSTVTVINPKKYLVQLDNGTYVEPHGWAEILEVENDNRGTTDTELREPA